MALSRRPATDLDVDSARRVHHLAYREVVEHQFGTWDLGRQDAYFANAWSDRSHEILEWHGEVCGYCTIEFGTSRVNVHELVVHPRYQNLGVGTAILRETLLTARDLGLPVYLQVLRDNRAAVLYERLGFEEYAQTALQSGHAQSVARVTWPVSILSR